LWSWLKWGDPVRCHGDLRAMLEFCGGLMQRHNLTYWLDYGVLLGCVRHRQLILWEYDLDFGMTSESFARFRAIMADETLPAGYSYVYKADEGYSAILYNGLSADFIEYAHEPEHRRYKPRLIPYYDDAVNWAEYCPPMPEEAIMPLARGQMWDREYPIPRDPDTCLRIVYGDYLKVDRIPMLFSYLYHPRQASAFMAARQRRA
jgi:phosphorylcholine metabolism protein LicD